MITINKKIVSALMIVGLVLMASSAQGAFKYYKYADANGTSKGAWSLCVIELPAVECVQEFEGSGSRPLTAVAVDAHRVEYNTCFDQVRTGSGITLSGTLQDNTGATHSISGSGTDGNLQLTIDGATYSGGYFVSVASFPSSPGGVITGQSVTLNLQMSADRVPDPGSGGAAEEVIETLESLIGGEFQYSESSSMALGTSNWIGNTCT